MSERDYKRDLLRAEARARQVKKAMKGERFFCFYLGFIFGMVAALAQTCGAG